MMRALLRGQFLMLAFLLLIVPHLDTILRKPTSLLIPGYLSAHRLTAVCLLGIGVIWSLLILVGGDVDWLAALALVLLIPTILAATLLLTKWYRGYQSLDAPTGILVLIVCMSLISSLKLLPDPVIAAYLYFLQGNLPVWAGAAVGMELLILLMVLRHFLWWPRYLNEHFATIPQPASSWSLRRQQEAALQQSSGWRFRWFDIPKKKLRYHGNSMCRQVWLLRKGNTYRPLQVFLLMALLIPVAFVSLMMLWGVYTQSFLPESGLLVMFSTQCVLFMLVFPAVHWSNRCSHLQREFLQPVSRKNLVRQLFAGLLLDQAPILLLGITAVLGTGALQEFFTGTGNSRWPPGLLYLHYLPIVLALLLWLMATSTSVIAFREKWVVILVFVILMLMPFYVTQVLVGLALTYAAIPGTASQTYYDWVAEDPATLFLIAVGLTALSLGVLAWMYRRALRREWG